MDTSELEKALDHDAARRGAPRPGTTTATRPVLALRRLLLDAVLLTEKADLTLAEGNAHQLRDDLLVAAHKLTTAANHLTQPHLYPLPEDKR